jgi:hypothetical protein
VNDEKGLKRSGHGVIEILPWNMLGGTGENQKSLNQCTTDPKKQA